LLEQFDVKGVVGPQCSGTGKEAVYDILTETDIVFVAPSTTSYKLSTAQDRDFYFRTCASDEIQAVKSAEHLYGQGVREVAVLHDSSDYGNGYLAFFERAFSALGGEVVGSVEYNAFQDVTDQKLQELQDATGDVLIHVGYYDDPTATTLLGSAIDSGNFESFHLSDSLIDDSLLAQFGSDLEGVTGMRLWSEGEAFSRFETLANGQFDASTIYAGESYDAAALMILAMQAAQSSDPAIYRDYIYDIANGEGKKIYAGDIALGLELIASGQSINYVGATDVTLNAYGDDIGNHEVVKVVNGGFVTNFLTGSTDTIGTDIDDSLIGTDGNDLFFGSAGVDIIDGETGLDKIAFTSDISLADVQVSDGTINIESASGNTTLLNVERIVIDGQQYAFDFQRGEKAYDAATIIGTAFGSEFLDQYFSPAIGLLDNGYTKRGVIDLVVELELIETTVGDSLNEWVSHVYENVIGRAPDLFTEAIYVNGLENGTYSKSELLYLASELGYVDTQIDITGLQQTGLSYLPFI